MKYYKLKKQLWVNPRNDSYCLADCETDKAWGFLRKEVDIHGQDKEIYIAKSICKVEDIETDTKQVNTCQGVEYVVNVLHEVTFYVPKWFFVKNRFWTNIGEFKSKNWFYSCEEIEMDKE